MTLTSQICSRCRKALEMVKDKTFFATMVKMMTLSHPNSKGILKNNVFKFLDAQDAEKRWKW